MKQSPSADLNQKWQICNMSKSGWLWGVYFLWPERFEKSGWDRRVSGMKPRTSQTVWTRESSLMNAVWCPWANPLCCRGCFLFMQSINSLSLFCLLWSLTIRFPHLQTHLIKFPLLSFVLQMYDCWWGKHTQRWLRKSIFPLPKKKRKKNLGLCYMPSKLICQPCAALPRV